MRCERRSPFDEDDGCSEEMKREVYRRVSIEEAHGGQLSPPTMPILHAFRVTSVALLCNLNLKMVT